VNTPVAVVRFADATASAEQNIVRGAPDDDGTLPWCPVDR
jgi:hypothetical protein